MSSTSASSSTASSSTSAPFNTKQIEQILTENDGFLNAIQEFQSMGKISEVIEFQKRLQLNLLQLVDSVSSQFKSTKENPETKPIPISNHHRLGSSSHSSSREALPAHELQESKSTRSKRSSFTDMPKI